MTGQIRITKREKFLNMMDEVVPWNDWIEKIRPYYPKGKRGRPPIGIATMLRVYLVQVWFNMSDEATEDALYDSNAVRKFVGIASDERAPDATTLLKFRHLLEKHNLCEEMFQSVSKMLDEKGCMMRGGTIIDATIIAAPSSTKNKEGKRDPEMHQTKKGEQWFFGMKIHIGVDAGTGYTHSIVATPANASDISQAANLLREDDEVAYGDAGYVGIEKRPEIIADERKSKISFRINRRPGSLKKLYKEDGIGYKIEREIEKRKSSVRSKVEHPFRFVKGIFGYSKVVYRGLKKNLCRFQTLFASANLMMYGLAGRAYPATA